uniref:Uncharacterized protein n=1 Tax=Heterorhabditis bacteriophora TaxID=37862 RepID=A0A1I7WNR7_HETBA
MKTFIRRRFECLKIVCLPASETYMPYRDFANSVKRMIENAELKELDYERLKTLLFIAELQDSTLSEVRLRMLAKLDSYAGSTPLTIDSLVLECENFLTLNIDNRDMGAANINAVRTVTNNTGNPLNLTGKSLQTYSALIVQKYTPDKRPHPLPIAEDANYFHRSIL